MAGLRVAKVSVLKVADVDSERTLLRVDAKLHNTALYAKVATRTVRTVTSPLDKLGLFRPTEIWPGG